MGTHQRGRGVVEAGDCLADRVKGTAGALALGFVLLQGVSVYCQVNVLGGFVENRGQWSAPVAYIARVGDHFVGVGDEGLWLHRQVAHGDETRRDVVRVGFQGLGAGFVVRGEMPIPRASLLSRQRSEPLGNGRRAV